MSHASEEVLVLPVVRMTRAILEVEMMVGRQRGCIRLISSDRTEGTVVSLVVTFVMMRLVAHQMHDAVEALGAEALDFVGGGLGGGLDPGDSAEEFGHNTTHDIVALSIRGVGRGSDSLNSVESDLSNGLVSYAI